jgi:hypothetical protein
MSGGASKPGGPGGAKGPVPKGGAGPGNGAKGPAGAAPAAGAALPPLPKGAKPIAVKKSGANYGFALSGKLGSQPELEQAYVRKFIAVDPKDGLTSLREAVKAYQDADEKDKDALWARCQEVQGELGVIRDKLLAAGYSMADMMKLTLDNS